MTRIAAAPLPPRTQKKLENIALKLTKAKNGKVLQQVGKKPPLGEIKRHIHNMNVARGLKGAIQDQLKLVRFGAPLSKADAPRPGKNGELVAPNGDPLIRVKLSEDSGILGESRYALVNPRTNEYYVQTNGGGFTHPTTYNGPLSLPKGPRFQGDKFTPADLKNFEKLANATTLPTLKDLVKAFEKFESQLKFGQPAPDPKNVLSQTVIKSQHPFSYYAVRLKDDPNHVVIKQVLTGGFVPAQPGSGTYSQPILVG